MKKTNFNSQKLLQCGSDSSWGRSWPSLILFIHMLMSETILSIIQVSLCCHETLLRSVRHLSRHWAAVARSHIALHSCPGASPILSSERWPPGAKTSEDGLGRCPHSWMLYSGSWQYYILHALVLRLKMWPSFKTSDIPCCSLCEKSEMINVTLLIEFSCSKSNLIS